MRTIGLYATENSMRAGDAPLTVHDHALAVLHRGRVESVLQLERITRRKHDAGLANILPSLLADHFSGDAPLRFAVANSFAGSAVRSADGTFLIEPEGPDEPLEVRAAPHRARVRWKDRSSREAVIVSHEWAHVASTLPFTGGFEPNSLLVHIDGGASDSASSFWHWDGQNARLLDRSWDRLKAMVNNFNASSLVRAILGLGPHDHLSMPGKLMGYAGHGEARADYRLWLEDNRWFLDGDEDPRAILAAINLRFGRDLRSFELREPLFMDLCATIQKTFEERIFEAIAEYAEQTGARNLYYSGGAALNIPTNARLEQSGLFEAVYVPPCPSDCGLALGAAAWIELLEQGRVERHDPYLHLWGQPRTPAPLDSVRDVARRIARGEVIGLCEGAAEVGPRALGHRSLIARADAIEVRRRVSEEIKGREWYRPVAPVVIEEIAREAFGEAVASSPLARCMLGAYEPRARWRRAFDGVLHRDGTVRVQVVPRGAQAPRYLRALLEVLWAEHRIPALINTSFNGRGEPLLHAHADAVASARRLGLDAVVVHGEVCGTRG